MEGQHLGAIRVSGELMLEMFLGGTRPGEYYRVDGGLPQDAEFVRCFQDHEHNEFVFVYRHPSFPLVKRNDMVPYLNPPMLSVLHGVRYDHETSKIVVRESVPGQVVVVKTEEEFWARPDGDNSPHVVEASQ